MIHATSFTVVGLAADLLEQLTVRDRGIYVSRLVERELRYKVDDGQDRSCPMVARMRLTDRAQLLLERVGIGERSRHVDAIVCHGFTEAVRLAGSLEVDPAAVKALVLAMYELTPTHARSMFNAAGYAQMEPRFRVRPDAVRAMLDLSAAQVILDLVALVPREVELVLDLVLDRARRERVKRLRAALKAEGVSDEDPASAP